MNSDARLQAYSRQTGRSIDVLSPPQRRRNLHKTRRAVARELRRQQNYQPYRSRPGRELSIHKFAYIGMLLFMLLPFLAWLK